MINKKNCGGNITKVRKGFSFSVGTLLFIWGGGVD